MKKQLLLIAVLVIFLLFNLPAAAADYQTPELVVTGFIHAVQQHNISAIDRYADLKSIKNQPRHSYTIKQIQAILAPVNPSLIRLSKPSYNTRKQTWTVRLLGSISIDFELKRIRQPSTEEKKLIIFSLHP